MTNQHVERCSGSLTVGKRQLKLQRDVTLYLSEHQLQRRGQIIRALQVGVSDEKATRASSVMIAHSGVRDREAHIHSKTYPQTFISFILHRQNLEATQLLFSG